MKIGVLRNFAKFTGKHLGMSIFSSKFCFLVTFSFFLNKYEVCKDKVFKISIKSS